MLIKAALVLLIYLTEYYLYGFAVAKICRLRHISMVNCIITGFWLQGLVFFIFVMPFKLAVAKVSTVAVIWPVVWAVTIAMIAIIWHKDIRKNIAETIRHITNNRYVFLCVAVVVLLELLYELFYGEYTDGNGAAYFVGAAASDLFTNHFGVVMPETGAQITAYDSQYFLQTYVHHTAVVCKLTGLVPLIEMRMVMASVVIIISGLVTYELSGAIFGKDRKKVLVFWLAYQSMILIFSNSVYIPAYYLFYRTFEGKTIFGMLLIPYVFVCFWKLYQNERDKYMLVCLVLALLGSYTYCMSTMYVLPFLLLGYLPVAVVQRKWRQLVNWCIMMMPSVLAIVYYLMVMKGIIDLTIMW